MKYWQNGLSQKVAAVGWNRLNLTLNLMRVAGPQNRLNRFVNKLRLYSLATTKEFLCQYHRKTQCMEA